MVMAIVVIVIGTAMAAAMVQMALAQRQQFESERRRSQAEWYAQAGLDRAAVAMAKSKDYTGETWTVTETGGSHEWKAEINIILQSDGDHPRIIVASEYPVGELRRARVRRELTLVTPRGAAAVSALQPENRLP
jgi:type II secretory pathway pseudopilin PulG